VHSQVGPGNWAMAGRLKRRSTSGSSGGATAMKFLTLGAVLVSSGGVLVTGSPTQAPATVTVSINGEEPAADAVDLGRGGGRLPKFDEFKAEILKKIQESDSPT